jgi:hypothetical protein
MNEALYYLSCWAIRLSPIILMGTAWLICHYRFPGGKKVWVTLAVGYLIGVLSVWLYWDFAGRFAPTHQIAAEIYSKDGAPRLFAPFVMPFFVGVYFLILWPATWLVTRIWPRKDGEATETKSPEQGGDGQAATGSE